MKKQLLIAALFVACTTHVGAVGPGAQAAQSYCPLLEKGGFGALPWDERIGGCVSRKAWGEARIEVAHYVYRVGGTKTTLESVTLIAKPGKSMAKTGRDALAVASAEAAALLYGEGQAVAQAIKAGKDKESGFRGGRSRCARRTQSG